MISHLFPRAVHPHNQPLQLTLEGARCGRVFRASETAIVLGFSRWPISEFDRPYNTAILIGRAKSGRRSGVTRVSARYSRAGGRPRLGRGKSSKRAPTGHDQPPFSLAPDSRERSALSTTSDTFRNDIVSSLNIICPQSRIPFDSYSNPPLSLAMLQHRVLKCSFQNPPHLFPPPPPPLHPSHHPTLEPLILDDSASASLLTEPSGTDPAHPPQ
jgi:hypothetical protein